MMRYLVMLMAVVFLSGCVPIWTGSTMQDDIAALKAEQARQNETLEEKQKELSAMVESARNDVASLNQMTKEATELLARNNADFGLELEQVRQELQRLVGKMEETDFNLQRLQSDLRMFKEDVDIRFADGGGAPLPEKADDLYKFVQDKFKNRDFRAARKALESFAVKHARDSRMADVVFMMGETYFEEGEWVSAVFEYQKVFKNYPRSSKAGDAVFRIGESYVQLKKCQEAQLFYESVVSDYPKSSYVSQARERLSKMKGGQCP